MPKEGSGLKPKGTMLERAIRELEKKVAECELGSDIQFFSSLSFFGVDGIFTTFLGAFFTARPPTMDVQESDPAFQSVKRRLPREVKQKLAKVARLAVAA